MADGSVVFSITADDADAQKKLNELRRDIEKTAQSLGKNTEKHNAIVEQLQAAQEEAKKTAEEIARIQEQRAENETVLSGQAGDVSFEEFTARKQAQAEIAAELAEQEAIYKRQNAEVKKLSAKEQELSGAITQQTAKLEQEQGEAGELQRHLASAASESAPQLSEQIANVSTQIRAGVKNILKWGFGIRSAFILMRRLRSAIKEGIKAFAEQDEETKKNITSLKNSLNTLKAAWGAAFAPILNAVAPMLQQLIDLLITAANAVQMFFAALNGSGSYKKIINDNDKLADSYGAAGGAAGDAKKQVMGFDELNKLEDKSGGGGGGGGSTFSTEDEDIDPEFMKRVQWLKDHFDEILIAAGAIGLALAAWGIGGGLMGKLQTILGLIMTIYGTIKFVTNYIDAWKNGITAENLTEMVKGLTIAVIGLGLAFGKTAAGVGLLVGGIALVVLGIKEWLETGELTAEAFEAIEFGLAAIGLGLSLITGNWIPALIAAVAMIVVAVIKNWDEIKKALSNALEAVKRFFAKIGNWIATTFNKALNAVKQFFSNIISWVISTFNNAVESIKQLFTNIGNWISTTLSNIGAAIKNIVSSVVGAVKNAIQSAIEWYTNMLNTQKTKIVTAFTLIKSAIVSKFDEIKRGIVEKFTAAKDKVQEIVEKIKGFFTNLKIDPPHIKMPHIEVTWSDCSQSSIAALLGITAIPKFSVNWYAKGGIVDGATLFGAGEAGKEAIVPLERNTEWIDMVADGLIDRLATSPVLNGSLVPPRAVDSGSALTDSDIDRLINGIVQAFTTTEEDRSTKLYLDGRVIAEAVTKYQRRAERGFA